MKFSFKYLPFLTGVYSTAPGIKPTNKATNAEDRFIFQVDDKYHHYLANKQSCRLEGIDKYCLTEKLNDKTIQVVNRYILNALISEYPKQFKMGSASLYNTLTNELLEFTEDFLKVKNDIYLSVFDALCHQVQEDIVVVQLTPESDYLAAIHLCSPNHWSPAEKIGKPFDEIHKPVADMAPTIKNYPKILQTIVQKKGPFTRFAWGIATDDRLNHHPVAPRGENQQAWQGRDVEDSRTPLFVRVERQNLVGFPEVNAFLFTIRTYFYNVESFTDYEKQMLKLAVRSMSPASLRYKGLDHCIDAVIERLSV